MGKDAQLKKLLIRGNGPETLGIRKENLEEVPAWVEGEMAPLLREPFRQEKKPRRGTALRYAGGIAAAVAVLLAALYQISPTATAGMDRVIQAAIMAWGEESTSFYYSGTQPEEVANSVWRPGWVPEGYEEDRVFDLSGATEIEYRNGEGHRLILTYFPVQEGYMHDMDNEHSDYRELTLNGQPAHLFESNTEGKNSFLVFYDETGRMAFQVFGLMPGEDLIRIAESMEQKK